MMYLFLNPLDYAACWVPAVSDVLSRKRPVTQLFLAEQVATLMLLIESDDASVVLEHSKEILEADGARVACTYNE